jgi:hypothetical protein
MNEQCSQIIRESPTVMNTRGLNGKKSNDNEMFLTWAQEKVSLIETKCWSQYEKICSLTMTIGNIEIQNHNGRPDQLLTRLQEECNVLKQLAIVITTAASSVQEKALDRVQDASDEQQKQRKDLSVRIKLIVKDISCVANDLKV